MLEKMDEVIASAEDRANRARKSISDSWGLTTMS
jgi:hypothetical protein